MGRPEEYNRLDVIKAAREGRGKTTIIAHLLGCSAETVRNYAKRYKTVANAIEEARRTFKTSMVDKAELKLEEAVMDGKAWAIRYALSTQGKDRGYTERSEQEISGAGGGPVKFQIDMGELSDDELRRIADGEDPDRVLATKGQGGAGATPADG